MEKRMADWLVVSLVALSAAQMVDVRVDLMVDLMVGYLALKMGFPRVGMKGLMKAGL